MTNVDYYALRNTYENLMYRGEQRQGQALMNALWRVHPDLYNEIHGTDADCFYDDSKVPAFYKRIGYW